MSSKYDDNLSTGKYWEDIAQTWFEKKGYSVERHTSYTDDGDETYQLYVYVDGNKYPHPDFTVTKQRNKKYIEIKSVASCYENNYGKVSKKILSPSDYFVSVHKYQFESYIQFARWKETDTFIFFNIGNRSGWYYQDVEELNLSKIKVSNAFAPLEYGEYFFWNINDLKRIK